MDNPVYINIHPPNLPLRPYLDDIWNVLDGFGGDIGDIESDIDDIEADIATIFATCCNEGGGGGGMFNIDGGHAASIYTPELVMDGGGA